MSRLEDILQKNDKYGVKEFNPLTHNMHDEKRVKIQFDTLKSTDKIVLERLRLITDVGFPLYDVSYVYMIVNGVKAEITGFPHQLPKRGYKQYLVNLCKSRKIFIKDIVSDDKISRLS